MSAKALRQEGAEWFEDWHRARGQTAESERHCGH